MRRTKFKPGEAIVYIPEWSEEKFIGGITYKNQKTGEIAPLRYGDVVHFLTYHVGVIEDHCIVTTYDGKVYTMLHPGDFRKAKENEV